MPPPEGPPLGTGVDIERGQNPQTPNTPLPRFLFRTVLFINMWRYYTGAWAMNSCKLLKFPVSALEIVLGFGTFLAGMVAAHDEKWLNAVIGFISTWVVLGVIWIGLDLHALDTSHRIKRILWHLGCCGVSLYAISSILHLNSDSLPQWLPLVVDGGIGMSIGLQGIPREDRTKLLSHLKDLVNSIFRCGCIQISLRRGSEGHLVTPQEYELGSASGEFHVHQPPNE